MSLLRRAHLFVLASTLFVAAPAFAQSDADKATARALGQEGQAALDAKDYKTAEDRFRRADSLFHAPTLALGFARAEAALGKVVVAQETYNRIIREGLPPGAPAVFVAAVEAAKNEVGAVSSRVAGVTITVTGPDSPKVTLDEQPVPTAALGVKRPVDPGSHLVKASAEGWDPTEQKFTVGDGAATTVALTLKKSAAVVAAVPVPVAPPPDASGQPTPAQPAADTGPSTSHSSQKTIGWIGVGVGGALLAGGVITGLLAMSSHSTLQNECPNGTCPSSAQGDLDSFHTMGLLSTIGFIGGGVLAAGGAVLVLTAPKSEPPIVAKADRPSITPYIGFGTVGASGRF